MKKKLIFKNLILLLSIITILKCSFLIDVTCKSKDYKDKYGVYLVLSN